MKFLSKFIIIFFILSFILSGCNFMKKSKTIELSGNKFDVPEKTLILNLSKWPQNLVDLEFVVDAQIYKTFVKSVFGDYVLDDEVGDQLGNTIFSKVWFEGDTALAEIRPGLKFGNGKSVSSEDVEYSITRFFATGKKFNVISSKNTMIPFVLSNIIGYEDAINNEDTNWHSGILKGIKIVNKNILAFNLKQKDIKFFVKLNIGFFPLVDKTQFESKDKNVTYLLNGCGDFRLEKYSKNHDFYLLKNIKPKNKNSPEYIAFIFTQENYGDIVSSNHLNHDDKNKYDIFVSKNLYNAYGFMFNFKSKLGADPRFRELFNLALDREKLVQADKYKRFIPDNQLIANFGDNYKYRNSVSMHNKETAIKLLNNLKNDYPSSFSQDTLLIPTIFTPYENPEDENIFRELISQFKEIGINIKVGNESTSELFFNPKSSEIDKVPVIILPKILVKESPMSNFNAFIPSNTNLTENKTFENSDENDLILLKKYEEALKDENKIKEFNQYFNEKNIFIVFADEYKNFAFDKNTVLSLGDQSEDFYINLSNIEVN